MLVQGTMYQLGVQISPREGYFLGDVQAYFYVPKHEWIVPAAGECACLARTADECIRRRER